MLRAQRLDGGDALGHRSRQPVRQVGRLLQAARDTGRDDLHGAIVVDRDGP